MKSEFEGDYIPSEGKDLERTSLITCGARFYRNKNHNNG